LEIIIGQLAHRAEVHGRKLLSRPKLSRNEAVVSYEEEEEEENLFVKWEVT
jgi:hypothetical protein